VKNVVGESDEDDVGADDAGHHNGMCDAEGADERLLLEIGEAFFHVGVNGERETGFGDFGIAAGFESFGSSFGGFIVFARVKMRARGDVALADFVEAKGGEEVGGAVDGENSGDAGGVIDEADEGAGDEHAALHADEYRGVGAGELAGWDDFLDERVDGGPVHGGADAGDERHGVEMPELEVAVPSDVGGGENGAAAREIEEDAEVAAVEAVDEHAAEERDEEAGQGDDDDLQTDLYSGVCAGEDVPTDAGKVHAAAEERDEHGEKKITEAALRPDEGPVDALGSGDCGGHGNV